MRLFGTALLGLGLAVSFQSHAATNRTTTPGPADKTINALVDAGKIIPCDKPGNRCEDREMSFKAFYAPDKKTAIAWVFGAPTEGSLTAGQLIELKDSPSGWKLARIYQKPIVSYPAPADDGVHFKGDHVVVNYTYKKDTDPNCCANGKGRVALPL